MACGLPELSSLDRFIRQASAGAWADCAGWRVEQNSADEPFKEGSMKLLGDLGVGLTIMFAAGMTLLTMAASSADVLRSGLLAICGWIAATLFFLISRHE